MIPFVFHSNSRNNVPVECRLPTTELETKEVSRRGQVTHIGRK